MTIDDLAPAMRLWRDLPGIALSGADTVPELSHFLGSNPDTCFVAATGKSVIGTILGGSDGRRGYIYHLAIASDFQKQGVGSHLLSLCLHAFRVSGIQKCHIFVIADNAGGFHFWQIKGWELRDDIMVMSKNL